MLTNETYTGTLFWNRTNYEQGVRTKNANETMLRIPNSHPAIIPKGKFDRVQQLLAKRSPKVTHPRSVASQHLLSGLLYCSHCGAKVVATGAKSGRFTYYTCMSYTRQGKTICKTKMLNTDKFEAFIIQVIKDRILTQEHLAKLIKLIATELQAFQSEVQEKLEFLEQKLTDVERRLNKLYRLIESDKVELDDIGPRLRELNTSKDQLLSEQNTLRQREGQEGIPCPPRREVKRYVEDLRETLDKGSLMERKGFLRSFIKRIDLNHPRAEIEYTVPLTPPKSRDSLRREVLYIDRSGWDYRTKFDLILRHRR
jgi:site-specific DNA recombinase